VSHEFTSLPGVSVALSTFNGERFLEQQLESLARQRVLPAELVACDDCSSDGTMAILDDFARSAPFPVRTFRNTHNLGFNASFFQVAERCEAPLIAFCDQDDVWEESKIGVCATFFAHHPDVRLVVHAATPVDEDLRPVGNSYPRISATKVVPLSGSDPWLPAPGFAMVFDAELLRLFDWRGRPPSRDLDGHQMDFDEWFYFAAWTVGHIGFLADCLVRYRQHGSNLFGAPGGGWRARLRKLLETDFATHVGRAAVVRAYAEFLEQSNGGPAGKDSETRDRLETCARFWRAHDQLCRRRDTLYDADSHLARLNQLRKLVASRAYRRRERGGLGSLALLRDLRETILPGRRQRLGRPV
jgi:glycosyltransferase involved in cell wall biosynthesis